MEAEHKKKKKYAEKLMSRRKLKRMLIHKKNNKKWAQRIMSIKKMK